MTDGYDCYQNALAGENKRDTGNEFYLASCRPRKRGNSKRKSVAIYNHERPHQSPEYKKRPDDAHQAFYRQNCQPISDLQSIRRQAQTLFDRKLKTFRIFAASYIYQ